MTIIAAASWKFEGKRSAYMACDTAGTDGWDAQETTGTKLCEVPFGWAGFSGNYRPIQVIRRALRQCGDTMEADDQHEQLVDTIIESLVGAGWSKSGSTGMPRCNDLSLLFVTWRGTILRVQSDLSLLKAKNFAAVGSGYMVAIGAMHMAHAHGYAPEEGAHSGVRAACDRIASCSGPVKPVQVL